MIALSTGACSSELDIRSTPVNAFYIALAAAVLTVFQQLNKVAVTYQILGFIVPFTSATTDEAVNEIMTCVRRFDVKTK